MKVRDLMTSEPATCAPSDHLAAASMRMWTNDCGILPVVEDGKIVGVITDRDIAMALAMREARATAVTVADIVTGKTYSCSADDDIADALVVMKEHQIRRVPVLDNGHLVGILSLNDVALEAKEVPGKQKRPTYGEVTETLRAICSHRSLPANV